MTFYGALVATLVMTVLLIFGSRINLMPEGYNIIIDGLGNILNWVANFIPIQASWLIHFIIYIYLYPWIHSFTLGLLLPGIYGGIVFALIIGLLNVLMLQHLKVPKEANDQVISGIFIAHILYGILFTLF